MRTPDILYQGQPGTTNTDLYPVPAGKKATITGILAANTNAANAWVDLFLVQNGGSVGNATCIAKRQILNAASDTSNGGIFTFEFPIPLNTVGDKISGIQGTSGAITVTIIGYEEAV